MLIFCSRSVTNLTSGPLELGGALISNYSQVFQLYTNSSGPALSGNPSATVKIFSSICSSNQAESLTAIGQIFRGALNNINTLLTDGSLPAEPSVSIRVLGVKNQSLIVFL